MASNYTEHYKLNQWELSDSVMMAEFNEDNVKIEQALLEVKETSRPKFKIGSYLGTNTYGEENPNSLTFDFEPQVVFLAQEDSLSANMAPAVCIRGVPQTILAYDSASNVDFRATKFNMIWEGNTFRWYAGSQVSQFNLNNVTYHYLAIG